MKVLVKNQAQSRKKTFLKKERVTSLIIGIPKEIKEKEYRVAITPPATHELVRAGHKVLIEKGASLGSTISDNEFKQAGATIINSHAKIFTLAEMVLKVKEPLPEEYNLLQPEQILFSFLHLAPNPKLTKVLKDKKVTAIAYETIELADGRLPLLAPMSEIAGRLAPQIGARFLEKTSGGRGILLGGVAGVAPGEVTILGGGIVGANAALTSLGLGARVTVIDLNLDRLRYLESTVPRKITTLISNHENIAQSVAKADLVIGAVLTPGASAPKLVSEEMVKSMKVASVIIDVAIDQGGCISTSRLTTYNNPVFLLHGVLHCGIPNIPSAVPQTATYALINATLPWILEIANKGLKQATINNEALAKGINIIQGKVTHPSVAKAQGQDYFPVNEVLQKWDADAPVLL